MSCRSNPGNSALTSHARFTTGLSDMQTLSTFHALIREGETLNLAQPSQEEFSQWLAQTRRRVQTEPTYDERRRQSLLSRLDTVASTSTLPNGATFYAWQNIEERSRQASQGVTQQLERLSGELGISVDEAREQFNRLRTHSDSERSFTAQSVFVDWERRVQENAQNAANSGRTLGAVPRDRGTQYALAMLEREALIARSQRAARQVFGTSTSTPPQHSTGVAMPPSPLSIPGEVTVAAPGSLGAASVSPAPIRRHEVNSTNVLAVGYDPASQRLQVEFLTGHVYEYTGVPRDIYQRMMQAGNSVGGTFYHEVRQAGYTYRRLDRSEVAAQDAELASQAQVRPAGMSGGGSEAVTAALVSSAAPTNPATLSASVSASVASIRVVNCPSCGQFMPREGSHACPALAGAMVDNTLPLAGASGEYQFSANPTVTEESLSRALDRASYGNVETEQLQTLQHSDAPFISPPPGDYAVTSQTSSFSAYPTTLTAPSVDFVREYVEAAGLTPGSQFYIYAGAAMGDSPATVEGPVRLEVGTNGQIRLADTRSLSCNSCGQSGVNAGHECSDIGRVINDLYARYNPTQRPPTAREHEQGQTRLIAFVASDRMAADLARDQAIREAEEAREAAELAASRYATNMSAFQQAYDAAKARKARGETPIPYLTENATGGLGARNGGRGFGVEIEFDLNGLSSTEQSLARRAIGRELYAAGITTTPSQEGYHSSSDYTQWRFEYDSTVSGEIISPILYDEPQSWQQLAKVCEIIKRHGGKATARTGGHVHVACGNYNHTPRNHNNLLRLFKRSEDVLYRLAQNPEHERHRGINWCRPNQVSSTDYTSIYEVQNEYNSHHIGLNFQAVEGRSRDHVEYRMWDGTLDPAAIQSQIKVSLAMTEAAFRAEEGAFRGQEETLGSHRATSRANNTSRRRLSGDAWQADTASFRNLVDTLFTRPEDKEQITALFAVTKWQS